MAGYRFIVAQLRQDGVGKLLAELNAHLVEAINTPDRALCEDLVFVECDKHAQCLGVSFLYKNVFVGLFPSKVLAAVSSSSVSPE